MHPSKTMPKLLLAIVTALALSAVLPLRAADAKPKYSIKDVMKALHKGDDNVSKRVTKGTASKEDVAKLVEYYQSLPLNTPEKGDKAAWEAKATALFKSAVALKAGEPDALEGYKRAVNCKACHSEHKPQ